MLIFLLVLTIDFLMIVSIEMSKRLHKRVLPYKRLRLLSNSSEKVLFTLTKDLGFLSIKLH